MRLKSNTRYSSKNILFLVALCFLSGAIFSHNDSTYTFREDTVRGGAGTVLELAKDEGIKCSRMELTEIEFRATCAEKYGELLRITYQDLERGGREIIFQKKMVEKDEVKFFIPFDFVKEAKTSVLIIMKGSGMFYKKIDITD